MTALKPKQIDLYQSFFEKPPITRKEEQRIAIILLPLLTTIIMAGCYGLIQMDIARLSRQIEPVTTYLNTIDTRTLHQRADILQQEDSAITQLAENMELLTSAVDSYPHLDKAMLESVYAQATAGTAVVGLAYDGEACILHIEIETDTPESGQSYIGRLRSTGHFLAIEHLGYSGGSILTPVYSMDISAMLPSPKEVQS